MKTPVLKPILLGLFLGLRFVGHAQEQGSILLRQAVHCLEEKEFLPPLKTTDGSFGYVLDEKSYPGQKMLYVVKYSKPSRKGGLVFTIFVTDHDGNTDFNIQNNARFIISKNGAEGVSFANPPLGGSWTQEHLISAIKQIEKQPRSTVSAKDMLTIGSSISCEAYSDPQSKTNAK